MCTRFSTLGLKTTFLFWVLQQQTIMTEEFASFTIFFLRHDANCCYLHILMDFTQKETWKQSCLQSASSVNVVLWRSQFCADVSVGRQCFLSSSSLLWWWWWLLLWLLLLFRSDGESQVLLACVWWCLTNISVIIVIFRRRS